MDKTYQLTSDYDVILKKRFYTVVVPMMLLIVCGGLAIGFLQAGSFSGAFISVPIILLASIFGLNRVLQHQQRSWASYRLSIAPGFICQTQDNFKPVQISSDDIFSIKDYRGGSLIVQAATSKAQIVIPTTLENYAEVRALLNQWHEIEIIENKGKRNFFVMLSAVVGTMTAFGIMLLSRNATLVLVVGSIFLVVLIGSNIFICRNQLYDKKIKRMVWWSFIPISGIALRLFFLLIQK